MLQDDGHDWNSIVLGWFINGHPDSQEFFYSDSAQNYGHYAAEPPPFIFLPSGADPILVRSEVHGSAEMTSPTGTWSPVFLPLSSDMTCPAELAVAAPAVAASRRA
nr:hypothetical protein [uncultured Lichenicoccus sp.]